MSSCVDMKTTERLETVREEVYTATVERLDTAVTVELERHDELPRVDFCFFCVDLRLGLNVWLAIECVIWIAFFITSLTYEVLFINQTDLDDFSDFTETIYWQIIFGDRFNYVDRKIQTYIILFNFILMLIFATYLVFCCLLAIGINRYKLCLFIPYLAMDAIFILLAFCGCVASFIMSVTFLFRVSFIFLVIKLYAELCVTSLFREYLSKDRSADKSETATLASEANQTAV